MACGTLGYPRIGRSRQLKFALEGYWSSKITEEELLSVYDTVTEEGLREQAKANVTHIGVGDQTLYDSMLDVTVALGLIPKRFSKIPGADHALTKYFAMARGIEGAEALDMSKWFDTNYHYLKPEVAKGDQVNPDWSSYLKIVQKAQSVIGKEKAVPIVIGPVTYARLSSRTDLTVDELVTIVLPGYEKLMTELKELEVPMVQVHEPALCLGDASELQSTYENAFKTLASAQIPINLVSYYDDLGKTYSWAVGLPGVEMISMDFTRGSSLKLLKQYGFPPLKTLGAGLIDGRSVWDDAATARRLLAQIKSVIRETVKIVVQPSCSLMHLPVDLSLEKDLEESIKSRLAFSVQKLALLGRLAGEKIDPGTIEENGNFQDVELSGLICNVAEDMFVRKEPFAKRRELQFTVKEGYGTTTVGSFPQTPAIRRLRALRKAKKISEEEYKAKIDAQIAFAIGVQEAVGLDVLVDGEPYRSDMTEFFGQQMEGIAFTRHGWVQSYGSRCVRPPIIHGKVLRPAPMTVREFSVAQSYTSKPVKGMLTGPVTILNWSFPRKDVSRREQAYQIALALRQEILDLEAAGCKIIQVDEPALREGLPLKERNWGYYLKWAVEAFRLATSGVKPETQIVTHLCYSEFGDIMKAIDDLDADVLMIENSRSGDEMLRALGKAGYSKDVGPGCYDIHSAVVPTLERIQRKVKMFDALQLDKTRIWVNPDCGLKTRKWEEVIPALKNMVQAAKAARAAYT